MPSQPSSTPPLWLPPVDADTDPAVWLDTVTADVEARVRAALVPMVMERVVGYLGVTAAGDLSRLDGFSEAWRGVVVADLAGRVAAVHTAGSLFAWVQSPASGLVPEAFVDEWLSVVNDAAVSYQAVATNRLVGAADDLWGEVRESVVDAVALGVPNEELTDQIEALTEFSEYRANTIARTETVAAYNGGDMAGARALGVWGPVEKVWLAAVDARTRETHADADGQVRKLDEAFDVGGVPMDRPHDPAAPPGEVVNCRCVVLFLYPGDERPDGSVVPHPEEI